MLEILFQSNFARNIFRMKPRSFVLFLAIKICQIKQLDFREIKSSLKQLFSINSEDFILAELLLQSEL